MEHSSRQPTGSRPDSRSVACAGLALLAAALVFPGCSYSYGRLELAAVEPTELRLRPQNQIVSGSDCTLYALGLLPLSRVVQDVGQAVNEAALEAEANGLTDVSISRRVTYAFFYSKECVVVRGRPSQL